MFDDEKDFTDLVEETFPYDGPHTPEQVREAARGVSVLIRYLNNATGPGNGTNSLPYAPHTYRLIGSVRSTVAGLDQLLDQASAALRRHSGDSSLYDDRRADYVGAETASDAANALSEARHSLEQASSDVDQAWGLSSHLGHDFTEQEQGATR